MSRVVHLDTQLVVWAHAGLRARLKPAARHLIANLPRVSPMVLLEVQYLFEIKRHNYPARVVLADLADDIGLEVAPDPWLDVVEEAASITWTRDPFDRLITAHAMVANAPLVTTDERIRAHCRLAVWD